MSELDILEQVANTDSKTKKEEILKKNVTNKRLADLLDASLNFDRKFFIKKIEDPNIVASQPGDRHDEFMQLLSQLESGSLRGSKASEQVLEFLMNCDAQQQTWYKRVIKKDLKAGFTSSTANKAGFDIPEFDCMLAKADKDCKKLDSMVAKGGFISPKFDGYRCVAEIVDGVCILISRNGTLYTNFPMINEALESLFPTGKHMLDGEIMSDSFQAMQSSAFADKRGSVVGDMKYHVFDTVDYDEWDTKKFKTKASDRFKAMEDFHKANPHPLIVCVKHTWVNNLQDIHDEREKCIAAGLEGVMFLPDIPYYLGKKSNRMLKFKEMESQDVTIIGCYEGEKDKELEGSLGGFIVLQEDGQECRVGTMRGVTREERQKIWDNQTPYIGRIFEAEYQELGSQGKMRFPVFVRWRDTGAGTGKI